MMVVRLRNWLAALAGAGFALTASVPALAAPPPQQPKLVVVLAIDQFAEELFQRYRPTFTGGLKRLGEGLAFTGYQSHGATETCPGHSTILTGDHPARTGIVANNWYDRATGSNVYCTSVPGVADPAASGSGYLRVDTLGGWLKTQKPGSRTIAVSGKDRAAIMLAGHHADAVYWWRDGEGFTTSPYAGPATASVLKPAKAFNRETTEAWRKTPPVLWPADVPDRCKALEAPMVFGKAPPSGRLPPQLSKAAVATPNFFTSPLFAAELRASPIFDPLALSFAERLVQAQGLGKGKATDLLAISLSSTDHVGHRYGNGGAEMCVQLERLDRRLGEFFTRLDALGTPYLVVLTADHGGTDAAERAGPPSQRVDAASLGSALSKHLRARFGLAYDPLAGDDPRQIIVTLGPEDDKRRDEVLNEALAWLKARKEVASAYLAQEIARSTPPAGKPVQDLTMAERFAESYDPERSGDIMVAYAEYATLGMPLSPSDNVAGHGSPWDYDRRVPILFWWAGAPSIQEAQPMETVDIAPTLAPLIGVTPPDIDGHCVEIGQGCPAK